MMLNASLLRPALIISALIIAAACAQGLRPQRALALERGAIHLQTQIPTAFGNWRELNGNVPILPNPDVEKDVERKYSQVLARTYVDDRGHTVMFTAAYGTDQKNEMTQVHRPEICYRAQGFKVQPLRDDELHIARHTVPVRRVMTQRGERNEPLSYWVTVGDKAVLPGFSRKLEQLRLGLTGLIADGMLIRVSSISSDQPQAFAIQDQFLHELAAQMEPTIRRHYFGF